MGKSVHTFWSHWHFWVNIIWSEFSSHLCYSTASLRLELESVTWKGWIIQEGLIHEMPILSRSNVDRTICMNLTCAMWKYRISTRREYGVLMYPFQSISSSQDGASGCLSEFPRLIFHDPWGALSNPHGNEIIVAMSSSIYLLSLL